MSIILHSNGEPLLNAELLIFTFFPSWQQCCLSSGLQMVMAVLLLPRLVPIYLMTILTDSFVRVIVHPSGQIEQGTHYIRKFLIYSKRKTFLEKAVVELVYKFDKKSYHECL